MKRTTLLFAMALSLAAWPLAGADNDQKKENDKFEKADQEVEEVANKAGKGAKKGMKAAGEGVEEGLEATGKGVGEAVEQTGRGVVTAGKKTGQALEATGDAVADFFGDDDPLDEDARVDRVRKAQTKLQKKGYYNGMIDGVPGPETVSALREFQQDKGLEVTGRLDAKTAKKLDL